MRQVLLAIVLLCTTLSLNAQQGDWMVQIAVYNKQVPAYHFSKINHRIFYSKDAYNFHRYYVGQFTEAEAEAASKQLEEMGFNTRLVYEGEFNSLCTCYKTPFPKELTPSLRNIFFDFDKYSLRTASKKQLNLLAKNLKENPEFAARIQAHTDAKGSNSYNDQLSANRAKAAKKYLISNGIDESRIKIETYGEVQPIAKNELDGGRDTSEGRQLNRRVEFQILNENGEPMNLVEEIAVPSSLRTEVTMN